MKVRYMLWKNMINRKGWDFRQAELAESLDEPENPGRGWYGIYTFMVEQSIDPGELRWSLRQGESLALVLLDIHAYRSKLLDEDALGNIRNKTFCVYFSGNAGWQLGRDARFRIFISGTSS